LFGHGAFCEFAFSEVVTFSVAGFFKVFNITRSFQGEAWEIELIEVK